MVHDNVFLKVSEDEASKVDEEAKRRLLASKKLSLVVDLDQTIIHATVDPTVGEWKNDPDNPNYDAVKDVCAFQLVDDGPVARSCWYYIKLRPGLKGFLENISKIYELHIYTMGTRAYAQNIANLIDPERKIFGDRILSRDESGSLVAKSLQRLFPVDTKMVVIIDDRGDVWKWNDNLIKVTPYDFFVGIGDINSSFLPKKPQLKSTPKATLAASADPNQDVAEGATKPDSEPKLNGDSPQPGYTTSNGDGGSTNVSALDQLVSMGGGDDPIVLQAQTSKQDETLAAQLQDRPLLQKQKQLEAEEDAASESGKQKDNRDSNASSINEPDRPRHNLLQDHDTELKYLEQALRKVHAEFFETHAQQLASAQGGRIAELRGAQVSNKRKTPLNVNLDLDMIPDVKIIMPSIKARVLAGVVIVFSGVVPLGVDVQSSDIALWAKSFGATVEEEIFRKRTTHLIAAKNRTAKVRKAVRAGKGKIKVVGTKWLMDSISQWKRLNETPYLLKTGEGDVGRALPGEVDEVLSESEDIGSSMDTDAEATESEGSEKLMPGPIHLEIPTGDFTEEEDVDGVLPDDLTDEQSPVGGTNEDWRKMQDELAEFLGSEADDSDGDSVASAESGKSSLRSKKGGGKRNHDEMRGPATDSSERAARKKRAVARSTNLSQTEVFTATGDGNGIATEERGLEDDGGEGEGEGEGDGDGDGDGDGWSDLEDDLEAEMERAASEEEAANEENG